MTITRLIGIYNADGGIVGEVKYIVGHLLGTAECALCDITHSPIRRKPEWDAMVAGLEIPMTVLHRNEVDEAVAQAMSHIELPAIVGLDPRGAVHEVLSAEDLDSCDGSVARCGHMIIEKLETLRS